MDEYRVQRKGTNRGPRGQAIPQYLSRKDSTYYFRQVVPAELRKMIIGKREIEKSLGCDFVSAVRDCKRFAVEAGNLIADARTLLGQIPIDPFSTKGMRRTRRVLRVGPEQLDRNSVFLSELSASQAAAASSG